LGTFGHMKRIAREEGFFAGLWKGNRTRMAKVAPGCAIMISCYELGKRILSWKMVIFVTLIIVHQYNKPQSLYIMS